MLLLKQNHIVEIDNDNDGQTEQLEPIENEESVNNRSITSVENHNNKR